MTNDKTKSTASALLVRMEERNEAYKVIHRCDREIWEYTKLLRKVIGTPKEYDLFKMRVIDHKTLEEVGRAFHVTRERIRQIDDKIMERLKAIAYGME